MDQVKTRRITRFIAVLDLLVATSVLIYIVVGAVEPLWIRHGREEHYARLIYGGTIAVFWFLGSVGVAMLLVKATNLSSSPVGALNMARVWIYSNVPVVIVSISGWLVVDYLTVLLLYIPIRFVFTRVVRSFTKDLSCLVEHFENTQRLEEHRARIRIIMTLPPDLRETELHRYLQPSPDPPKPNPVEEGTAGVAFWLL